jgi:ankyrin repeat protein
VYAKRLDADCVACLVRELGFDVNHKRRKDHCTPLHIASYFSGISPMVETLLALGADPSLQNKWGEKPKIADHLQERYAGNGKVAKSRRSRANSPDREEVVPMIESSMFNVLSLDDTLNSEEAAEDEGEGESEEEGDESEADAEESVL